MFLVRIKLYLINLNIIKTGEVKNVDEIFTISDKISIQTNRIGMSENVNFRRLNRFLVVIFLSILCEFYVKV